MKRSVVFAALALGAACSPAAAGPVTFSAAATGASGIQATVDSFRAALGVLNPNVAGSFGSGRREINWDGVPDARAAPNALPADFFNVNSPRGVVFSGPGTGFAVSANAGLPTPVEFGNINPTYPGIFAPFSAQRLFTPLGSNVTDVSFFVPGSATAAFTNGFGVVFTDVDVPNVTSVEFFGAANQSLGKFFAPSIQGEETLSFLGVLFNAGEQVTRVRIVAGNQALGPNSTGDVVAMDDFVYGEPRAVPEPATLALALLGLAAAGLSRTRRR